MSDDVETTTAPTEPQLFGREEALNKAGHTFLAKSEPTDTFEANDEGFQAAAESVASKRPDPDIKLTPSERISFEGIDPALALTVEESADLRTAARADIQTFTDGMDLVKLADEVDAAREKKIAGNPEVAKALGVEMPKHPELAKAEAEIDAIDGLDNETRKALKSPQIRQAIEQEFTKAEQATQAYSSGLETARVHTLATLGEVVPHLMGLQPAQFEQGLAALSQVDPPAFQKAMNILGRAHAISQAQQEQHQHQAQVHHQQFQQVRQIYSHESDKALGPMTRAEKVAMADELVNFVGQYGISREQLAREVDTNLALHHPAFQRMAADALKWQRMQKAGKAHPTRAIPNVQKPGTSNDARASANTTKLAGLQDKLAKASGDKAARIAAEIRVMKRRAS